MLKLDSPEFSNPYLDCYEAAVLGILKSMGLSDETPLMGTQAYFVLSEAALSISPRHHFISEEWKRVHGLIVETFPIVSEIDLQDKIKAKLDGGFPVCIPADIYYLPHTSHHHRLHQYHFVDIFGYDEDHYYVVCPYYHYTGWMSSDLVHASFNSSVIERKSLVCVPELKLQTLSLAVVHNLVEENCHYMLGLSIPETLVKLNPQQLGLVGLRSFIETLQKWTAKSAEELSRKGLDLSVEIISMGSSRYWFYKLLQSYEQDLLPLNQAAKVQEQFMNLVRSWRAIGLRLGAEVYVNPGRSLAQAASRLEQVYLQEYQLFNRLLEVLPGYEGGTL